MDSKWVETQLATVEVIARQMRRRYTVRVDEYGECREWEGSRYASGYGAKWENGKMRRAHRVEWEKHYGPIPEGMWVLHKCDNPPCCNIDHLWLGTRRDNERDKVNKGRHHHSRKTTCPQGHAYTGLNKRGNRICRICIRERWRASRLLASSNE